MSLWRRSPAESSFAPPPSSTEGPGVGEEQQHRRRVKNRRTRLTHVAILAFSVGLDSIFRPTGYANEHLASGGTHSTRTAKSIIFTPDPFSVFPPGLLHGFSPTPHSRFHKDEASFCCLNADLVSLRKVDSHGHGLLLLQARAVLTVTAHFSVWHSRRSSRLPLGANIPFINDWGECRCQWLLSL